MENSADPEQLTSDVIQKSADSQLIRIQSVVHTTWHCEFIIIDKKMKQNYIKFLYACPRTSTKDGQKVLSPLYFGLPGNEILTITFQYNLPSRKCT